MADDASIAMLERRLAASHGTSDARLVANATTGLCLALKAAGLKNQQVGIPNGVCINVPLAVLLSGNTPVYLDIDERHLGLSVATVTQSGRPLAALIAVHAYGSLCGIGSLAQWCRANSVFLIEDLAAAQGARLADRPAGSWGDVSVMSFGRGKIIDVGEGGAVLTNDRVLLDEIARAEADLSVASPGDLNRADELNARHTGLYNAFYGRGLNQYAAEFKRQAQEAGTGFVHRGRRDFCDAVLRQLDRLAENLAERERRARLLFERFRQHGNPELQGWQPADGSVYWRFNLLAGLHRDRILKTLLSQGFKVSSWFTSVDLFLEGRSTSGVTTPVSDKVGDRILNLWVNDEVDDSYVIRVADTILALSRTPSPA